jgi:urease gamma subunit
MTARRNGIIGRRVEEVMRKSRMPLSRQEFQEALARLVDAIEDIIKVVNDL